MTTNIKTKTIREWDKIMQNYECDDDEDTLGVDLSKSMLNVEKSLQKVKKTADQDEEAPPPENQMSSS